MSSVAAATGVSFVLTVDFERKRMHVWAGRSGSLKKRSSSDLIRCVEHSIAAPDFASFVHQYARYDINVIASYPASAAAGAPVGGSSRSLDRPRPARVVAHEPGK